MRIVKRKFKPKAIESPLVLTFVAAWRLTVGEPAPVREFVFHPVREWRFDVAWPDQKVAIEIQGGTYSRVRGAHSRPRGQSRDFEKINAAQLAGWRVIQFDAKALSAKRINDSVDLVKAILGLATRKEQGWHL